MILKQVKITVKNIRNAVREILIKASDSYMKKEVVRAELEKLVRSQVKSKQVSNQAELDELFKTFEMAANALTAPELQPMTVPTRSVGVMVEVPSRA